MILNDVFMLQNFDVFKDENNNCFQLRTKTNSYALEFDDQERENIFLEVVAILQKDTSVSLKQLKAKLAKQYSEPKVIDVLKILDEYELLSVDMSIHLQDDQNDTGEYRPSKSDKKQVSDSILSIVGNGELAQALLQTAKSQSFKSSVLYPYNDLQHEHDIESIVNQSDFLIIDGNEWSPYHAELVNKHALKNNKPWLYVAGIEGVSMKIGPLFYGKETGCYHCLIGRIKSNHDYPLFLDSYERHLRDHKIGSKPDILPNADLMYYAIANLTLLEVMKFFQEWSLPVTWRTLLNFDAISFKITQHTLLKKPFCEVCKPSLEYHPAPWLELVTLK